MNNIKIILMGTPSFSVRPFKKIIEAGYNVVGIVSQPDRPQGRKKIVTKTPTKILAEKYSIPVLQPEKIKVDYSRIIALNPDLIVTCAYGQIIPKEILQTPKYGCINIHASLLPELRGGAPIHKAIMTGKKKTGITIMDMVEKMDAGDIITQSTISIGENETTPELFERLSDLGAKEIIKVLPKLIDGTAKRVKQDENLVTYAWNISKEEEWVSFEDDAKNVHNKIRGLAGWPVAHAIYKGERFKIHSSKILGLKSTNKPGTILIDNDRLLVACNDLLIELLIVQPFGKQKQSAKEYLNGTGKNVMSGDMYE